MPSDRARSLTPNGSPPAASSASRIAAARITAGAGLPSPTEAKRRRPSTRSPVPESSVEVLPVNDIEQFPPVDQAAEVLREELRDASVLVRTESGRVRRDHHLRHRPQR